MLTVPTTIKAASLTNCNRATFGTIHLDGLATSEATLDVGSAAGFGAAGVLYGNVSFSGDALIEFKSGQITTIAADSAVSLIGSHAFIADASDTSSNSALKGLKTVAGELDLSNGAKVKTSGALTNDGSVNLSHTSETIGGAVSGTGNLSLSNSTLEFANGVSSGETVTFGSGVNHLHLDSPSSFLGTIEDFLTPGDSVSAKTFAEAATLLTYTQTGAEFCSWTLSDGVHTAVLNFAGAAYAQTDFSISASANGNTVIKFV